MSCSQSPSTRLFRLLLAVSKRDFKTFLKENYYICISENIRDFSQAAEAVQLFRLSVFQVHNVRYQAERGRASDNRALPHFLTCCKGTNTTKPIWPQKHLHFLLHFYLIKQPCFFLLHRHHLREMHAWIISVIVCNTV